MVESEGLIKLTKSGLAIVLSKLKCFNKPKVRVEQYGMDPEIGAEMLWQANLIGDIQKVSVVDMGCGTGILGIGALLLGAKEVYFVENDCSALEIAKYNWNKVKGEYKVKGKAFFLCQDIGEFNKRVDVVLENPPFGTKVRHSDRFFLEKAIKIASVIYSFHKSETKRFVECFCRDNGFRVTNVWDFRLPIKATQDFHRKRIYRVKVSCFRMEGDVV